MGKPYKRWAERRDLLRDPHYCSKCGERGKVKRAFFSIKNPHIIGRVIFCPRCKIKWTTAEMKRPYDSSKKTWGDFKEKDGNDANKTE